MQLAWTEALGCWRLLGPWALALQVLVPCLAWLQEPAFLRVGPLGMVETAVLGVATGIALCTPAVWSLSRWTTSGSVRTQPPPASYGIAVATGVALYLFCNALCGIGLALLLGRLPEPAALVSWLAATALGGCLLVLPIAPWLPFLASLSVPPWLRTTFLLGMTAATAVGFCPDPAELPVAPHGKMVGLFLATAGSLALLVAIQLPRTSHSFAHAHRHPR